MSNWIGAAIGAGSSLLGGVLGNAASAKEAAKARDWAEYMYKNRYQMSVADMRAAGLNPILAGTSGISGGFPSATGASQTNVAAGASDAFSSVSNAQTAKQLANQQKVLNEAQIQKTQAETRNINYQTDISNPAEVMKVKADTIGILGHLQNETRRTDSEISKMAQEIQVMISQGSLNNSMAQYYVASALTEAKKRGYISAQTRNELARYVGILADNDTRTAASKFATFDAKALADDPGQRAIRHVGNYGKNLLGLDGIISKFLR